MAVIRNRKVFFISIFILFCILYWAIFFPLLLVNTRTRVERILWITIIIGAVVLFLLFAVTAMYLVKKYNYWMLPTGSHIEEKDIYGFTNQYSQQKQHNLQQNTVQVAVLKGPQKRIVNTEVCEVFVDKRVLQDAETQTEDGSISPGLYRTSLIMDVQPRSPSDTSSGSMWYYPTLAEYYKDKTIKLRGRLNKAQQEPLRLDIKDQELPSNRVSDQVDCSVSDTRLFLKREQLYHQIEIK